MTDWDEAFQRFTDWFADAQASEPNDPNAMSLASLDPDGWPSVRIVLMKDFDRDGFVFYTNYGSNKARAMAANPTVSLLFPWNELDRQVIIAGRVEKMTMAESASYFVTRPRESQIAA